MRAYNVAFVVAALVGSIFGCNNDKPLVSGAIKGRLDAALAITDMSKRSDALARVAEDAGAAGDVDVAKQAIDNITDVSKRSDTASAVALKLAEAGKTAEATEIAKKITDVSKRNAVLAKLAKG